MADITSKIAQLITATQVAFNAGSKKGVKVGDYVTLYRTVDLEDPETKEPLGTVRVPRLLLRVNLVQEKFCVAEVITSDIDNPTAVSTYGIGRVKVTTGTSTIATVVRVQIGEEGIIHTPEIATQKK